MQKITTFLWFDHQTEEAVNFYVSLFKDSRVLSIKYYGKEVPGMEGKVLTAVFELNGQRFMALDGGPMFKFTEAVSLFVDCEDQAEVDMLWEKLTADGGEESQCGWLKDKYGLSWQIIPRELMQLMSDPDPAKAGRVMQCMLQMKKIDVAKLREAYNQE